MIVTCPDGAIPPTQGGCGVPIPVGASTSFSVTGLSNYAAYTVQIIALDMISPTTVAESIPMLGSPTDHLVYLPLALR